MIDALLVVAHGSRRAESNDEVRVLTERVRHAAGHRFAAIECAFLELAPPSIPDGLARLIDHGATHITVLPYFLAAGRHVAEDIPAEVEHTRRRHPGITIEIAPYLGTSDAMPGLLLDTVDATG
ncbi:CbiX/SirB N-terminal domain-containing protein [Salinisphaera sp.]|uniref:sirohydrochlorin chelatase n=1 Tax=Salinisphaera sp. TaxID=1914330 RepID=UPI002D77AA4F|nr:CbiX/SirB N-terminal domain-containing protein [Salinisphaera sp.]HET7315177.1 CbiX/SirB N-terminal domain-containing protein [Salinisphaera sp.]